MTQTLQWCPHVNMNTLKKCTNFPPYSLTGATQLPELWDNLRTCSINVSVHTINTGLTWSYKKTTCFSDQFCRLMQPVMTRTLTYKKLLLPTVNMWPHPGRCQLYRTDARNLWIWMLEKKKKKTMFVNVCISTSFFILYRLAFCRQVLHCFSWKLKTNVIHF